MALDTENKRRSVHGYTLNWIGPEPDGTVSAPDRAHVAGFYSGLTFAAITKYTGGVFWPPHPEDIRVTNFFDYHGITPTKQIDYEFRWALGKDMGLTELQTVTVSVDDMWDLYKAVNNITDESAPFTFPP